MEGAHGPSVVPLCHGSAYGEATQRSISRRSAHFKNTSWRDRFETNPSNVSSQIWTELPVVLTAKQVVAC